jgi:hypothetical protein
MSALFFESLAKNRDYTHNPLLSYPPVDNNYCGRVSVSRGQVI